MSFAFVSMVFWDMIIIRGHLSCILLELLTIHIRESNTFCINSYLNLFEIKMREIIL
jgi:hypothetical protein